MRFLKIFVLALFVGVSILTKVSTSLSENQVATEAPAGFDNQTNGFVDQNTFDADKAKFEEREEIADGLGPIYNAQARTECHQNPVTGGSSQITELRAGYLDSSGGFADAPGGSLINDRAIDPLIQERVPKDAPVRTFRMSLNLLGGGFVEAIDDNTFIKIAESQFHKTSGLIAGQVIEVPILEAPGQTRVGRFGWKNQHASLLSFSADAYLNEMGITTPLQPTENTSLGRPVGAFDKVPDPDDDGEDVEAFTRFIRSLEVPLRNTQLAATADAQAGSRLFDHIVVYPLTVGLVDMTAHPAGFVPVETFERLQKIVHHSRPLSTL